MQMACSSNVLRVAPEPEVSLRTEVRICKSAAEGIIFFNASNLISNTETLLSLRTPGRTSSPGSASNWIKLLTAGLVAT